MPPYSCVKSNEPRGNSRSRRSLANSRILASSAVTDFGRNGWECARRMSLYRSVSNTA